MGSRPFGITDDLVALVKREEGWRARPYLCPAGYPTIGYGHVIPSLDHPSITKAQGEALLRADLRVARAGALRYCPRLVAEPEPRIAAIIDFVFNLGAGRLRASSLRRRVNAGRWDEAARELRRWVYGGGRKLAGLVRRREVAAFWMEAS